MRWLALLICWVALGQAAEPPPIPDPFILGERLALIDHLKTAYGVAVPPGEDLAQVRARYHSAWTAASLPDPNEAAAVEAETTRLRLHLDLRFHCTTPTDLDLAGLRACWQHLQNAETARMDAALARRVREDAPPAGEPVPVTPRPLAGEPEKSVTVAPPEPPAAFLTAPAAATPVKITPLSFAVPGVAGAALLTGKKTALCVQFGMERETEFHDIFPSLYASLIAGAGPPDAVFLLGHGSGVSINGAPISDHLRANRVFYETFGGTRPAQHLTCLVIASCSRGSPVQMSAMRDGLGYYPTWRVATAERSYATRRSVVSAFTGIATRADREPFRGIWRAGRDPDIVGSIGEVGIDGAKGNMQYFELP